MQTTIRLGLRAACNHGAVKWRAHLSLRVRHIRRPAAALSTIALAAAVLGGLTSPFGAVIGGFLVGIFENLAGTYIPGVGNELKLPIALALIISVLVVKPAGLFGQPIVKRV